MRCYGSRCDSAEVVGTHLASLRRRIELRRALALSEFWFERLPAVFMRRTFDYISVASLVAAPAGIKHHIPRCV